MGMHSGNGSIALFNSVCRSQRLPLSGMRMAEVGNQHVRRSTFGTRVPSKKLFELLGVDHVSIDLNGLDGALPLDLARPITDPELVGSFDMVTNFGTSEHVDDQFECWRNLHNLACTGGLMLHLVPTPDCPPGHCEYYYDERFFEQLVDIAGYEQLELYRSENQGSLIAVALRKTAEPFPEELTQIMPERRPGKRPSPPLFTKRLRRLSRRLKRLRAGTD